VTRGKAATRSRPGAAFPWRRLAVVLAIVGVWGIAAPYAGPLLGMELAVAPTVEFVDHVLPGVIVLLAALVAAAGARLPLPVALVGVLAGFWMTLTHLPLLAEARRGSVPVATALFHSVPGIVLTVLAAIGALAAWRAEGPA
jgi:hypothetical protein